MLTIHIFGGKDNCSNMVVSDQGFNLGRYRGSIKAHNKQASYQPLESHCSVEALSNVYLETDHFNSRCITSAIATATSDTCNACERGSPDKTIAKSPDVASKL